MMNEKRSNSSCFFVMTLFFVLSLLLSCVEPIPPGPGPNGPGPIDPDPWFPYEEISQGIFVSGSLSIGQDGAGQLQIGDRISFRTTANYSGIMEIRGIGDSLRVKVTIYNSEGVLQHDRQEFAWEDKQEVHLDGDGLYDLMWQRLDEGSVIRSRNAALLSVLEFPDHPEAEASSAFQFHQGGQGVLFGRIVDQQWRLVVQSLDYEVYEVPTQGRMQRSISFRLEGLPDLQPGDLMILPQWEGFFGIIREILDGPGYRTFFFEPDEADVEEYFVSILVEYNLDAWVEMLDTPLPTTGREEDWDFQEEWDRLNTKKVGDLIEGFMIRYATETTYSFMNDQATLTADTRGLVSGAVMLQYEWRRGWFNIPTGIREFRVGFSGEMLFHLSAGLRFAVKHSDSHMLFDIPVLVAHPLEWIGTIGFSFALEHEYGIGAEGEFTFGYEGHCARHYFLVFWDRDHGDWVVEAQEESQTGKNVFRFRRIGPTFEIRGNAYYALNLYVRPTISLLGRLGTAGFGLGPGMSLSAEASVGDDQEFQAQFQIGFPLKWSAAMDLLYVFPYRWSGLFYEFKLFEASLAIPWRPTNLNAGMLNANTVGLEWDSDSVVAHGFEIQRRSDGEWEDIEDLEDPTARQYSDTGYAPGIPNDYRIRSYSNILFSFFGQQIEGPPWRIPSLRWSDPTTLTPIEGVTIRAEAEGGALPGQLQQNAVRIQVNEEIGTDQGTWSIVAERTVEPGDQVRLEARALGTHFFDGWFEGDHKTYENPFDFEAGEENRSFLARFHKPGEMVRMDGGQFRMGNTRSDAEGALWEVPVHTVYLTYQFDVGRFPVTLGEYQDFLGATGRSHPKLTRTESLYDPVIGVSWVDAIEYCNWLSAKERIAPAYDGAGNLLDEAGQITQDITKVRGYRLLTEAEWEYAARGGDHSVEDFKYAGSNTASEVAWYLDNARQSPQRVGQLMENELRLWDMSGNVWEWCHDEWDERSYEEGDRINPVGSEGRDEKILRGGSWNSPQQDCRVAARHHAGIGVRNDQIGFRVARTFEPMVYPYRLTVGVCPDDTAGEVRINEGNWGFKVSAEVYEYLPVTVEAREKSPDWLFAGWYDYEEDDDSCGVGDNEPVSREKQYTFIPDANRNLKAHFVYTPGTKHTISVQADPQGAGKVRITTDEGSGQWSDSDSVEVDPGTEVQIEASEAHPGYFFVAWYEGETPMINEKIWSFSADASRDFTARYLDLDPDHKDLEEGKDQIVKGAPGSVQFFRFERPYDPNWHSRGFDVWHVDILIHNRDGNDELPPEGVDNAEFFVKRDFRPSFEVFDERSGKPEINGDYIVKQVRIEKVEALEVLYIMVHGLGEYAVGLQAKMVWPSE